MISALVRSYWGLPEHDFDGWLRQRKRRIDAGNVDMMPPTGWVKGGPTAPPLPPVADGEGGDEGEEADEAGPP